MKVNLFNIFFLCLVFVSSAFGDEPASFRERISSQKEMTFISKDVEEEVLFGREIAARILGRIELLDNEKLNRYVNLVGKAVATHAVRSEIEYRFAVLDTKEINAYSTPGGYIFVTKGALQLMENEAELAAVLAHEVAHVSLRHIVKELDIRASDESPFSTFARFIGGGSDPAKALFNQSVEKALTVLFKDGYKRADELEADKIAILLTALSSYKKDALINYLKRLANVKGSGRDDVGKTHPLYEERFSYIEKEMAQLGGSPETGVTNRDRFIDIMKNTKIK